MSQFDWPGNVRELKNLVERLSIMVTRNDIREEDLPGMKGPTIVRYEETDGASAPYCLDQGKTLREVKETVEKAYIADALGNSGWNVTKAAKVLGIERTNLHKKIKYYEIER